VLSIEQIGREVGLDLRSFLADEAASVWRVSESVDVVHGVTALQYALEAHGRRPILRIDRPRLHDGRVSEIPVVCNLTASRAITARALGIADHRETARIFSGRTAAPVAPVAVEPALAKVREVVVEGDAIDLRALPVLMQHVLDPGPYLTAAHATTFDPETKVDNTAIQRCWIKGPRRMSWYPYPASHNARNLRKFWAKGEPCPVAFWIGHHPAVLMGTQAKLAYPQSHWAACGGLVGAPLRLVPSVTHGERIMVPADAEIVIEGYAPKDVLEADGPFGEYAGYMGAQTVAPIVEVTCVTRRRDAIYHDYGSGLADMLVPDNMAMEGKLFGLIQAVAPSLVNVHVPVSGRRFHAYLQLREPAAGEARDALAAALSYRRTKAAIALDQDIDIFDDGAVMWAVATRVQWDRDTFTLSGMSGSLLDPSLPFGARTTSKIAIDATMPPATSAGAPRPFAARSRVPDATRAAADALVAGAQSSEWPAQ
jgi:2,5-furandicarboxylate decarboxylase 1